MNVLNFGSVMEVFRRNISDAVWPGQSKFYISLFWDYLEDNTDGGIDEGLTSKRMNGKVPLSKDFVKHYSMNKSQQVLKNTIIEEVLQKMPDSAMAVQELYDLLIHATNVTMQKKVQMTEGFPFEDEDHDAVFITEVLCLAIQLPFINQENQLHIPKNLSPSVTGYLHDTEVPNPCKYFVARDDELKSLHALLMDHGKVFLHGIPGIGKSELAKQYAKCHNKEYTNVIYLNYSGDLKQMITKMEFADDRPGENDDIRFRHHNSFLKSLHEDYLLIIDNFNVTASQDLFIDEMLKYRCRILFTTRNRYEEYISMELTELSQDTLFMLVSKFFPEAEKKRRTIIEIIKLLYKHTFAVELAARLLRKGLLDPRELRKKLQKEKAALDTEDKIHTVKDGKRWKATYYAHIHSLFSLHELLDEEQEILRSLTLIPARGVLSRQFATWMKHSNMNAINDLLEMGFVHPKNDREILLHPMIREIAVEELKPSVRRCSVLLDSLQEISLNHGREYMENRAVFHTVESIMETVEKDDPEKYLRFLEDVFQYMDKYRYISGMKAVLNEMAAILSDSSVGTSDDRACVLDCAVALETDIQKQIELERMAIRVLGEVTPNNALLASNLNSNLGALYHQNGHMDLAWTHMGKAARILKKFALLSCHDSIVQICNYATLLSESGEVRRAYVELEGLAVIVQESISDQCLDYGLVQQTMGSVSVLMGDISQAQKHLRSAMKIFELVFEEEQELLEEKRREIAQIVPIRGPRPSRLLE